MGEKILEFLSKQKTLLFLIMCLMVHAFNAVLFYCIGLFPFSVLNVFSTIFYATVLLCFKKNTDFYIVFTYFEIITFSFISELFSGGAFCYIFYVVGMISVVFYLLPPKKRMKHLFQWIGIIYAIAIYLVYMKQICLFPEYAQIVDSYKGKIGFLNLGITLFTLFYISNLYFFEMNAASDTLTYCSNHDLMTGLFNRRFFEHIMQRNKTENENDYTIAIFDIDDFKKVNDTYGHQAGDCVLKTVSEILEDNSQQDYVTVRWGGEEFILYMPQTSENEAYNHLEKLCNKIRSTTVEYDEHKIRVTVTVGMCTGSDLTDYENVIRQADDKLYYGKRNGKNCVVR
ncbi:GGDEF domain-containing protein [uncultured Treponema sp.]|uniref:GGDEF domain-containing protein n=1 Tax=uncultured Treponema sp. TaxID=162155 RepID=UPI0025E7114E|nr:GGDEF domain-containing protein [uncultured Treponema sp.]